MISLGGRVTDHYYFSLQPAETWTMLSNIVATKDGFVCVEGGGGCLGSWTNRAMIATFTGAVIYGGNAVTIGHVMFTSYSPLVKRRIFQARRET